MDVKDVSWADVMIEVVGKGLSAGTERYHCELGGKTKVDLFMKVSLVGKVNFGGSLTGSGFGMGRGGGAFSGFVFSLSFCFFGWRKSVFPNACCESDFALNFLFS